MLEDTWKVIGRLPNSEGMYQVNLTNVGDCGYHFVPLYTN